MTTLTYNWHLKRGQSCGVGCYVWEDGVRLSLIVGHPAGVGRELLVGVGTLPSTLEMGVESFFLCSSPSFMMFTVFWL